MDSSAFSLKVETGLFVKLLNTVSPSFKPWELPGVAAKVLSAPSMSWVEGGRVLRRGPSGVGASAVKPSRRNPEMFVSPA